MENNDQENLSTNESVVNNINTLEIQQEDEKDLQEDEKDIQEDEDFVPMLLVYKNECVIDKIYLHEYVNESNKKEEESILLIGRFPDCHVVVDHPSISRFHLQLQLTLDPCQLLLTDLSSVHGTWLRGKRLTPQVPVSIGHNDEFRIGASSRVYRLLWVPSSSAHLDVGSSENRVVFSEINTKSPAHLDVGSSENQVVFSEISPKSSAHLDVGSSKNRVVFGEINTKEVDENRRPEANDISLNENTVLMDVNKGACALVEPSAPPFPLSGPSSFPGNESVPFQTIPSTAAVDIELDDDCNPLKEINEFGRSVSNLWMRRQKDSDIVRLKTNRPEMTVKAKKTSLPHMPKDSRTPNELKSEPQKYKSCVTRLYQDMDSEEFKNRKTMKETKSQNGFSNGKLVLGLRNKGCFEEPFSVKSGFEEPFSVKSGQGSSASACQQEEQDQYPSDKENMHSDSHLSKRNESQTNTRKKKEMLQECRHVDFVDERSCPKNNVNASSSSAFCNGDDYYPSDKENLTPRNTCDAPKTKADGTHKIRKAPYPQTDVQRMPFQSLSMESSPCFKPAAGSSLKNSNSNADGHSGSRFSEARKDGGSRTQQSGLGESNTKWYMVADASCMTDQNSLRALKKLQGIKGTQLIIPKIVVRELDCIKRRGASSKKGINVAEETLKWIGDCMVSCKWWIHVQNSNECFGISVTATPPASPNSHFGDKSNDASTALSGSHGSLAELLSPTPEDHILECALQFRKLKSDGRIALLSNDAALKVNAMAEDVICENAEDFCHSLTSPDSERFLWVKSSACGYHWVHSNKTCLDMNFGQMKKKHGNEKRKKSTDGAKGLKLILVHNSHYNEGH